MSKESEFEAQFCTWLKRKGCFVIKNNASAGVPVGCPDRTVLMPGGGWAMLEFKKSAKEKYQPLQEAQLARLKQMFYSATVYPENAAEIKAEIEYLL